MWNQSVLIVLWKNKKKIKSKKEINMDINYMLMFVGALYVNRQDVLNKIKYLKIELVRFW